MSREDIVKVLLKAPRLFDSMIKGNGLTYYELLLLIAIQDICKHEISANTANLKEYDIYIQLKDVFAKLVKNGYLERVVIGEYILTAKSNTIVNRYVKELSRYIN